MPVNRGPIARAWTQYAATFPESTKAEAIRDARRTYYAGARATRAILDKASPRDEDEVLRELAEFAEAVKAGTM